MTDLRRARLVSVIAAVAAAASLLAGTPASATDIDRNLRFACQAGISVGGHVAMRVPNAASAGRPIRFGDPTLTLRIPARHVPDIVGADAPGSQVSGGAHLAVTAAAGGAARDAGWPEFTASIETREDAVILKATGPIPSITPQGAVEAVVLRVTALSLRFRQTSDAESRTTTCRPEEGPPLAVIPLRGRPRSNVRPPPPTYGQALAEVPDCTALPMPGEPGGGFNPDPRLHDPRPGKDGPIFRGEPSSVPLPRCAKLAGFVNAKKQAGAIPLAGDAQVLRNVYREHNEEEKYLFERGYLINHASPSTATLLGFGFLPTRATTLVDQVSTPRSKGSIVGNYSAHTPSGVSPITWGDGRATGKAFVGTRVTNLSANGVQVELGQGCRAGPIYLEAERFLGNDRVGREDVDGQGLFSAPNVTVPAFSGCGVGEDLSPLLTATVSGSGNSAWILQGRMCKSLEEDCDAQEREPESWSVDPGGTVVATAAPFEINSLRTSFAAIRCEKATFTFRLMKGPWQDGFRIGRVTEADFAGCTAKKRANSPTETPVPTTLSVPGDLPAVLRFSQHDQEAGTTALTIPDLPIDAKTEDCPTPFEFARSTNPIRGRYANDTGEWELAGLAASRIALCGYNFLGPSFGGVAALEPRQTITSP